MHRGAYFPVRKVAYVELAGSGFGSFLRYSDGGTLREKGAAAFTGILVRLVLKSHLIVSTDKTMHCCKAKEPGLGGMDVYCNSG